MLTEQNNYDFKSELLVVHETNVRDYSIKKTPTEFEFVDGVKIFVANYENEVVMTAVRDFEDYLFTSHGVSAFITKNPKGAEVTLSLSKNLGEAESDKAQTLKTAYLLQFLYGALPIVKLPLLSRATHERHRSSLFGPVAITLTVASLNATTEFVVPRSIPMIFPIMFICYLFLLSFFLC